MVYFTEQGCSNWVIIHYGNNQIEGENNNLSDFEIDLQEWNEVSLRVKNNILKIFLNNKELIKISPKIPINQIMGAIIRFKGSGAVDM
ncbi:MAG: hypothetical protein HC905_31955 [Bacteroidales bacterium]|nr:hypothetical protein [Bacteroidales bacterium]